MCLWALAFFGYIPQKDYKPQNKHYKNTLSNKGFFICFQFLLNPIVFYYYVTTKKA